MRVRCVFSSLAFTQTRSTRYGFERSSSYEPAVVLGRDRAVRVVRELADDGHVVPARSQVLGEGLHPGLRGADLGREVLGEQEDPHRARRTDDRRPSQGSA